MIDLDQVVCEPCGGVGVVATRFVNVLGLGADLVECRACGARFYAVPWCDLVRGNDCEPAWQGVEAWAAKGDPFAVDTSRRDEVVAQRRTYYAGLLAALARVTGAPFESVFEIGAGLGECLAAAVARGLRVAGCDVNRRSCGLAGELHGVAVEHAPFGRATLPAEPVDAVVCLDVIEHTDTPRADLVRARSILRPGGGLLLKTFYDECHDHLAVAPRSWDDPTRGYFDPIGHRWHFTEPALRGLVERTGFEVVVWEREVAHGQVRVFARRVP